ncbi:MAG: glycine--tRNA ligase subunit beta, partial [Chloroflexi bacterium]|nr:glycine--tRNA ligase subunit beta [Chloroflexota bacterium]
ELSPRQPDQESLVKGPPASRAYDAMGAPTKAAEGFARGKGLRVEDLQVREIDGGQYVVATVHETGRPAVEVLQTALAELVASIRFDKAMRWNASNVAFSRPVRWLLALLGEAVIPFEFAGLTAGRTTRSLRFYSPEEVEVSTPAAYFEAMQAQGVLIDSQERRAAIAAQVAEQMRAVGAEPRLDEGLLDEVNNLVERPMAFLGKFDQQHLRLPAEVLISVMKKHQRYFPVQDAAGKLMPYFVGVRNGDGNYLDVVADGNEQVIRARFADAAFFIDEDLKHKLEDLLPRLGTLTFQFKLGSMLDKSRRIERIVEKLNPLLGAGGFEAEAALRAAHLCKADLVSHMVVEMTSLQGSMGRYYAGHSGEKPEVAQAIFEHYLPRFAGDQTPQARPGLLVGLADRFDTLAGLFAAGMAPSGTKDPFAQRRAALGLVQSLIAWDLDFDVRQGLALAAAELPLEASPQSQKECLEFITGRLRSYLLEQEGYRYDVVDAVLAAQGFNPAGAKRAVQALSGWVARPDWNTVLPAYARCVRITRDQKGRFKVDAAYFAEPAEKELFQAIQAAEAAERKPGSVEDFFQAFLPVIPVINRFFEAVLVMADEEQVRSNRLGLLQRVAALAEGVADFAQLEGF